VITGLQLGRPGVIPDQRRDADPSLRVVRLDVTGFVGVALRGPVNVPTSVSSWSEFERIFGGYEPAEDGTVRLLPYSVQAFFAQGGATAVIVRVAPAPDFAGPTADEATAVLDLGGHRLEAASEGTWGG
jgi:uncharacterized protein